MHNFRHGPLADQATYMYDCIVVGGGVVGPAFAKGLARYGRKVLVLERDLSEPDRIVGELLQPGGIESLKAIGMEKALEGIDAAPIYGYEVIYNGNGVDIPYPKPKDSSKLAQGRAFHHGRFVQNLRRITAETQGIDFLQATVTDILMDGDAVVGVRAKFASEKYEDFRAPLVAICDGTSSKFRKNFNATKPEVKSYFVGLILHHPQLVAPNHGHVIIGPQHQPILVYEIGSNEARCLCDVPAPLPSASDGSLARWLAENCLPYLPEGMKPSFRHALETQRIRSMPNQYLPAVKYDVPGLVIVGDALNMRHPLTGGGMTVGFADAVLLSSALGPSEVDWNSFPAVKSILQNFRRERKQSSAVVNVLSVALYSLFAAQSPELEILQRGCFKYFLRGGECVNGPVSLLSGLTARPSVLFYHFFSVAFYSIYLNFMDKGLVGFPIALVQAFTTLWTATVVFLPFLWRELWV